MTDFPFSIVTNVCYILRAEGEDEERSDEELSFPDKFINLCLFIRFMLDFGIVGEPEKLTYVTYFFPIVSSAVLYSYYKSSSNLTLLILTLLAVVLMESYHLAYKATGSIKERKRLVYDFKNFGLRGKKFICTVKFLYRMLIFMVFVLFWNVMYIWNLVKLSKYLNQTIFLFVFLAQIGLYVFVILQIAFAKRMLSGKLN